MSDETTGGFFQFPLCLIGRTGDFPDILRQCFYYGVVQFLDESREDGYPPLQHLCAKDKEDQMNKARKVMNFQNGSAEDFIRGHKEAAKMLSVWQAQRGKGCTVRLRTDLMFAVVKGDITEREMRVLLGIYSMIGAKPYSKIGWPMIQARAAGHMSPAAILAPDATGGPLYSRGQIDRTCVELIDRGLVTCATYKRGERFWTHRLESEELWKLIEQRKIKKARSNAEKALTDLSRSAQIDAAITAKKGQNAY